MTNYARRDEFLNSRRFHAFPVGGHAMPINVNGKLRTSAFSAWKIEMSEWRKPVVHRAHPDMPYLRDRDERGYFLMLGDMRHNLNEACTLCPAMWPLCLLDAHYDTLQFLSWSETLRSTNRYELVYPFAGIDGECCFVGWHNHELFMLPTEERATFYVQVPGWRKKYKPCRTLLVTTRRLFSHDLRVLVDESIGWKALYRAALTDHYDMVLMMSLHRVHPEDNIINLNISGSDLRMPEYVYKGVIFLLQDAVVWFVLKAMDDNVVAKTRYFLVLALMAVLRSS